MGKGKRKIAALLAAATVVSAVGLGACEEDPDSGHVHEWGTYYLAKEATCTEDGILECVCDCGEKNYQTLTATGHAYSADDVCSKCGAEKEDEPTNPDEGGEKPSAPTGETLGWSLEDIYETYTAFGYANTYEDFKNQFAAANAYVSDMYVGALGGLHLTVFQDNDREIPVALPDERVDFEVENSTAGVLNRLYFEDGNVVALETDGTETVVGAFDDVASVAVNKQNLLLVCFEDGRTIEVAGKIAENAAPIVNANLIFREVTGGYSVVGMIDKTATEIEIPLTHRGLPVKGIEAVAFSKNTKLTSVIIGANVTAIGSRAFGGCTALTSVTFAETGGWLASGVELASSALADTATAASYLTDDYKYFVWTRS